MSTAEHGAGWRRWLPSLYYYFASLIGLVVLLIGLISALQGALHAVAPRYAPEAIGMCQAGRMPEKVPGATQDVPTAAEIARCKRDARETARERGVGSALNGLVMVVVGVPLFGWHLRQARKREHEPVG